MLTKKILLVFFLDAIRYDYINSRDAPFINEMATNGISGPLKTILAFDGIATTIFTGTYPNVHGVWTQHLHVSEQGSFDWVKPFSSLLDKTDQAIKHFNLLQKALRFAVLRLSLFRGRRSFYPGVTKVPFSVMGEFDFSIKRRLYEPNAFRPFPTMFDLMTRNGISFAVADHPALGSDWKVVEKALRIKSAPDAVYLRFMDLDEISHNYGIHSLERLEGLRLVDIAVHTVTSHFERKGFDPFVVLFADHGVIEVKRRVDVIHEIHKNRLREGKDFLVFLDSTMARFWAEESVLAKISDVLNHLGNGRVLTEIDLIKYHIPTSPQYGNLVYLVDPGTIILPNYYDGEEGVLGMHGYDPSTPGLDSILIMYNKKLQASKIPKANMVDILPTILDILGISQPQHCVGESKLVH